MEGSVDYALARKKMIDTQLVPRGITDLRVLEVMSRLPRHKFVDEALHGQAYDDNPLPIGLGQTISQPYIVALMTQELKLKPEDIVLEIGTGSGYQTAILADLCEHVYSIERLPELKIRARRILDELKLFNVSLKTGDGTLGWPEHAPYDAIIVTAASPRVQETLVEQLAVGGRLLIPVGDRGVQRLKRFIRTPGGLDEDDFGGCRFVALIGQEGWEG